MIGLAPGVRLAAHAQEAPPSSPAAAAPVASNHCTAPAEPSDRSSSDMRVPGGCLLGATLGTFIFPGLGTALGCAGFGAVSWGWGKLTDTAKPPATAQACAASSATPVASR
jgi:hypothetical protein